MPTIVKEVSTGKLLFRVMLRVLPVGTRISGGCHVVPCVLPFVAEQVAAAVATSPFPGGTEVVSRVPHVHPHIGTVFPSGKVVVCLCARRVMLDWANDAPAASRKIASASTALFVAFWRWLGALFFFLIPT